jgi:PAS domain S-box-containing protein
MGGALLRRLLPPVLGVPIVLASVALVATRRGIVPADLGLALVVVASTGVVGAVALLTARSKHELDLLRRRGEALLHESATRIRHLSAIVDAAEDAIVSFDSEGRVATWNRGAEQILARPARDAIGRRVGDVMKPEQALPFAAALARVLARGAVEHFAMPTAEGATREVMIAPIVDWSGRNAGASAVLRQRETAA